MRPGSAIRIALRRVRTQFAEASRFNRNHPFDLDPQQTWANPRTSNASGFDADFEPRCESSLRQALE